MIRARASGRAMSVLDRLRAEARERGRPFSELLELYAIERLLHRLGQSRHRNRFVLKGALLLRFWLDEDARPTRDIDVLGPEGLDEAQIREALSDLFAASGMDDGIEFDPGSLAVRPIRPESPVGGMRARFVGFIGRARIQFQIDFGMGDSVTPPPIEISSGVLLGMPDSRVLAYTPYTSIAEKLEAMVVLGRANTRMKDFHDIAALSRRMAFDGETLVAAIRDTFTRRGTSIPSGPIECLDREFADDPENERRWQAWLRKSRLEDREKDLPTVIATIRKFVRPAVEAIAAGAEFQKSWPAGGPWK